MAIRKDEKEKTNNKSKKVTRKISRTIGSEGVDDTQNKSVDKEVKNRR
jgi:hypothetical protein